VLGWPVAGVATGVVGEVAAGEHGEVAAGEHGEVAAFVAAGRAALGACERADEWGAGARAVALVELGRVESLAARMRAAILTAERQAGTWSLRGDRDLAGFVGRVSHQGRGAGIAQVQQAEALSAMPTVADALVDGPVTAAHVAQIAKATTASAVLAAELATPEGQGQVVALARRLDGAEFGKALRQLSASLDPATRQREHDEQWAGRYLNLSHTPGGTLIKGSLDSVAGYQLAKALDALCPRPAKGDDRDRGQRQADALGTMARRILTDKKAIPDAVAPVQAIVTLSEATWVALRGTRAGAADVGPMAAPGSAVDVLDRLRGAPPVVDEDGRAWPASEIGRALCDCALTRVVLNAAGQPLDLGRGERLFTRNQWLALYASGRTTCGTDGCTMPFRFTELHHMRWWEGHDGRTDMANMAPECTFHHQEIHRLGLTVTRRPDGSYEHRHPDGRLYGGALPGDEPPGPSPIPGEQPALWTGSAPPPSSTG
jgi:hypothetical protein